MHGCAFTRSGQHYRHTQIVEVMGVFSVELLVCLATASVHLSTAQNTHTLIPESCTYSFVVPKPLSGQCPGNAGIDTPKVELQLDELQRRIQGLSQQQEIMARRLATVEGAQGPAVDGDLSLVSVDLGPSRAPYVMIGCPTNVYAHLVQFVPVGPGALQLYPTRNQSKFEVRVHYPPFSILCSRDNWIEVQSRHSGLALSFNRTLQEYRDGFGSFRTEFWLGLEKLHQITSNKYAQYTLRLEGRRSNGYDVTVEYLGVYIAGEDEGYKLTYVKRGQATRGNGNLATNVVFQTWGDTANKTHACVPLHNGWWYRNVNCLHTDLNFNANSPYWDKSYHLVRTSMMLKPVFF